MKTTRLRRWLRYLTPLILLAYACLVEPYWLEWNVYPQQTSTPSDKIRLVQLSDLHLQQVGRHEQAILTQLAQLKPDMVVLTGDVIDHATALPELERFLAGLGTMHKIAILGNWEYWSHTDLTALKQLYQRYNVTLLVNQRSTFSIRQRTVDVIGLDDATAGSPDLPLSANPKTVSTILLQHSPGWFAQFSRSNHKFDLCLAGHTHGGQVTLFGLPIWTPGGSGDYTAGYYDTALCPLYVSKGVGTSLLPIRFGARPEIAVFEL